MRPPSQMGITKFKLSVSSRIVFELLWGLPHELGTYMVYADNFFVNVKLASALRTIGIALCGTSKCGSGFSRDLLRLRSCSKKSTDWGKKATEIVDNVLCLAWVDNNVVQFLTTGHDRQHAEEAVVWMSAKKRVGIPDDCAQKTSVSVSFSENNQKMKIAWKWSLPKPACVDEYNRHMGGVDRNAQMRASYHCRRKSVKYWHALFVFIIEVAVQNAFRMHEIFYTTVYPNRFFLKSHQDFIESLARQLISLNAGRSRMRDHGFVVFEENARDQLQPEHVFEQIPERKRKRCWSCMEQSVQKPSKRKHLEAIHPNLRRPQRTDESHKTSQTSFQCKACQKPCCKGKADAANRCWDFLHEQPNA